MLDKLTRYLFTTGPHGPATAGGSQADLPEPEGRVEDVAVDGEAAPSAPAPRGSGGPSAAETWAVRDLMVEGAATTALRDVFAQERTRATSGPVITVYDPQRMFAPVLPRLAEVISGAGGDRIRLVDARTRKSLAVIDRTQLNIGPQVLRLFEVEITSADRPTPEVPLTLLEQSDVGVALLGPEPQSAWLESLLIASLLPGWRCTTLILAVPRNAELALARLSRYAWPAGTRVEQIGDPQHDLPPLWAAALRPLVTHPDAASHIDRISQMLASVTTPAAAPDSSAAAEIVQPLPEPQAAAPAQAAVGDTPPEPVAPAALRASPDSEDDERYPKFDTVPLSTLSKKAGGSRAKAAARSASGTPPASSAPADAAAAPELPMPAKKPNGTPHTAAAAPASTSHAWSVQVLEPLMRLPGAVAAATVDLRDGRIDAQLGAAAALQAAAPALALAGQSLQALTAVDQPIDEWMWSSGGRQHVLQPIGAQPPAAVLVIVDIQRGDLPMTRWSCTVARNALQRGSA